MHAEDIVSSRIGFGCGRLQGGMEKKSSIRLINTALDVGIRHFDVAPSYGLGAAEQVLGEAIAGCTLPLTVATKVGIPRPQAATALQALRAVVKPIARVIPGLRSMALKTLSSGAAPHNFHTGFIEKSFRESLALLQRPRVDFLLLHEPSADLDFRPIQELFSSFVEQGFISNYGSSTGSSISALVPFGNVAQFRCPMPDENGLSNTEIVITHGAYRFVAPHIASAVDASASLRNILVDAGVLIEGKTDAFGALAIAYVLGQTNGRLLVSTHNPERLVNTMSMVRQIVQSDKWKGSMEALRATFASSSVLKKTN